MAAAAAANQRRSVQEQEEGTAGEEAVEAEAEEGEGEDDDGEVATVAVSIGMDEVLFGDDEDDEAPPEAFDPDTAFASPAKSSTSKSSPAAGKGKQEEEKEAEAAEAEDAANALFRRASFENNIFADSNGDGGDGDGGDAAAAADALFAEDEEEESGVEAKAKAAAVAAVVNPFEVGDEAAQSGTSALDAAADLFDTLDVADPEPAAAPGTNSAAVNNNPFADDDEEDVSPDKAVIASNPFEDVDAMFAAPPKPMARLALAVPLRHVGAVGALRRRQPHVGAQLEARDVEDAPPAWAPHVRPPVARLGGGVDRAGLVALDVQLQKVDTLRHLARQTTRQSVCPCQSVSVCVCL